MAIEYVVCYKLSNEYCVKERCIVMNTILCGVVVSINFVALGIGEEISSASQVVRVG